VPGVWSALACASVWSSGYPVFGLYRQVETALLASWSRTTLLSASQVSSVRSDFALAVRTGRPYPSISKTPLLPLASVAMVLTLMPDFGSPGVYRKPSVPPLRSVSVRTRELSS
jgi:hypothetical protein